MRSVLFGLFGALTLGGWALGGAAVAQAPEQAELGAPIHRFVDAFNKGDMTGAAAAYAPADLTIIDELPPYIWRGPGALGAWAGDLMKDVARRGLSNPAVAVGEPVRWEVDGASAYVIAPAVYSYKQNGVDMQEPSRMTFTLAKGADGWKITSWTWTGPKPTPGPPGKP